jgi:hypothetical protein
MLAPDFFSLSLTHSIDRDCTSLFLLCLDHFETLLEMKIEIFSLFLIFWSLRSDLCAETDECQRRTHNCHANATCTNVMSSFTCRCNPGFSDLSSGTGRLCVPQDADRDNVTDDQDKYNSSITRYNFTEFFLFQLCCGGQQQPDQPRC